MQSFKKDELLSSLPSYISKLDGFWDDSLEAYLHGYGLYDLTLKTDYRIGHLLLGNVRTVVQSFSLREPLTARGTVIVVHGYLDHSGLYQHLISHLLQQRFNVVIYDLNGHGLSEGTPWDIEDFQHYAEQLAALRKVITEHATGPIHLVGQSTGGAIITTYCKLYEPDHRSGANLLLAPLVRPAMWRAIQRRYKWLHFFLTRVPRRYSRNSHDTEFMRFISQEDPLQHESIPLTWVGAMLRWGDWLEAQKGIDAKAYVIQGTDDGTVDWRYNLLVLERLYAELDIQLVTDAKHHLINESPPFLIPVLECIDRAFADWEQKKG